MSHFQLTELTRVFNDESEEFDSLDEYSTIASLTTAAIFGAFCLANIRGAGYDDKEQEISVIHAMTAKKLADNIDTRKLLLPISETPLIKFFYPNLSSARPISKRVKYNNKPCKPDDTKNFLMEI